MGTLFRYVADHATRPVEHTRGCHICARADSPIYLYHGWRIERDGQKEEVEYLCRECILTHDLRWYLEDQFGEPFGAPHDRVEITRDDVAWPEGEEYIVRNNRRISRYVLVPRWEGASAGLIDKLRHTPQSPCYFQWPDWVVCCRDLCEFVGSPGTLDQLVAATRHATFWEHGLGQEGRDFALGGPPEGFEEISVFRCLACGRRYWIDQFT